MAAVEILHFVARGSPQEIARSIEDYARSLQGLQALVVPWESDGATLNLAVTSVTGEGWAIEHKNLGTLRLKAVAADRTEVTVSSALAGSTDPSVPRQLVTLFDRFAAQLESRFQLPA